jgi:hypothetical protein
MPLIFSYGSLQQDDVQRSTFGRLLDGWEDELPGFEQTTVKIEDPKVAAALGKTHHANATFTGRDTSRVAGMVFEITDEELASVDAYEAPFFYARVSAVLGSGRAAWVYIHGPSRR